LAAVAGVYMVTRDTSTPLVELAPLPFLALSITKSGQNVVLTWQNDATAKDQLQTRASFGGFDWQQVQGATSSPVTISTTNGFGLFRLVRNPPPAPTNVVVRINGATPTVVMLDWQNTCTNCDSVNIDRATGTLIWTQLAQLTPSTTNYTDSNAPDINSNQNYYRVRSRKDGIFSLD